MTEIPPLLVEILQETMPGIQTQLPQDGDRTLSELGLDSLDKMSLLLMVQERYNLEFAEAEIKNFRTLNDIAEKLPK